MEVSQKRFLEIYKMMSFLQDRGKHTLREEHYLDSMCVHYSLYEIGKSEPVAKLLNEFNKFFVYQEH